MTLIVGILCTDGVVIASDSSATFGKEGVPTIGQQHVTKLHKLAGSVLYSSTGAIGIAQLIAHLVQTAWENQELGGSKAPEEVMDSIGKKIAQLVAPYLQTANLARPLVGDASASLCKSLVALPVRRTSCLFTFDYNGAPERASAQLPFVALGSGQPIADPFLALLRRLLWRETQPSLAEGRLVATWTIDHVRLTHPGGVGGAIQLATLSSIADKQPTVTTMVEEDIQEHLQQIRGAERALVQEVRPTPPEEAAAPPKAPS